MKTISSSPNAHQWPRHAVPQLECRKRDLVVRIADWTRLKDEPAFDVEVYIGGVYDFNESKTFSVSLHGTVKECRKQAAEFAAAQIAKLL